MVRFFPSSTRAPAATENQAEESSQQPQQSSHRRRGGGITSFLFSRSRRHRDNVRNDDRFRRHMEQESSDQPSQELLDLLQAISNSNNTSVKRTIRASDQAIEGLMHFRLRKWSSPQENVICQPCCTSGTTTTEDSNNTNDDFEDDFDEPACVVCSEAFVEGSVVSRIPCGHVYHADCLLRWLYRSNSCPTCRYELATDDPNFEVQRKERMKDRELDVLPSWENLMQLVPSSSSSSANNSNDNEDASYHSGDEEHDETVVPSFKFLDGIGELKLDDFDCLSLQIVHDGRRTIGYWHMDRKKQQQLLSRTFTTDLGKTSPSSSSAVATSLSPTSEKKPRAAMTAADHQEHQQEETAAC